ncbi:hypothetical protein [Mitsuokella sp.]
MARASAHPNFAPKAYPAFGDFFLTIKQRGCLIAVQAAALFLSVCFII